MSLLHDLHWNAIQFIMNVRENYKVSHTVIEQIIDGVINLVDIYSSIILVSIFIVFISFLQVKFLYNEYIFKCIYTLYIYIHY